MMRIKGNQKLWRRRIGFTLTELLVVVIIIGILGTLALPMLLKSIEKAKVGEAINNLNLIRTGQKIYFLEYSTYHYNAVDLTDFSDLNIEDPNATSLNYFDYTLESADGTDFVAQAKRKTTAPAPYSTYWYQIKKDGNVTSNGPLI